MTQKVDSLQKSMDWLRKEMHVLKQGRLAPDGISPSPPGQADEPRTTDDHAQADRQPE